MEATKCSMDQERKVGAALTRLGIDHRLAEVIYDDAERGTKTFRDEFAGLAGRVRAQEPIMLSARDQSRLTRADNAYSYITDIVYAGGRFISTGEGIDTT